MTVPTAPDPPRAVAVVVRGGRVLTIKRFLRLGNASECVMCRFGGNPSAAQCPGHDYAVLPGGGVEVGETPRAAAERELAEETTLTATAGALLWSSTHNGREAYYYEMESVTGEPRLAGQELLDHGPNNSFELGWTVIDDLPDLGLYPPDVVGRLRALAGRIDAALGDPE